MPREMRGKDNYLEEINDLPGINPAEIRLNNT
ncbi:hypothetical protein HNP73_003525 [Amaricoccus macauensis]|uniref:Uncharacterized protein n=1 Tax=Amaricoccus macauensis TaxID=57001 RepID=A0A840SWQ8_9RHOB|nr:hypothetical protein [Amaricoccus macauensis]